MTPLSRCLALVLFACSGDVDPILDTDADTDTDTDTDADADTDTDTDTDTGGTAPVTYPSTWSGVSQLLTDQCDRCHPSQQGVDLHVEIPLRADPYDPYGYVIPGDPDGSYLWQVVSGRSALTMPMDGLLPIETVQCIHDWIEAGAMFE